MVMPGDTTDMTVALIQPIAMDEGLRFAIREGGRTVGAGSVDQDHQVIWWCGPGGSHLLPGPHFAGARFGRRTWVWHP